MRTPPTPPWGLIADDLSGACDSAIAFAVRGFSASVVLEGAALPSVDAELAAYSTETRESGSEKAAAAVTAACRLFRQSEIPILFKKIDSTLRGPYAPEIAALMRELRIAKAVLNPAFPEQRRVVEGGEVFVVGPGTGRQAVARIASLPGVESPDACSRDDLDEIVARAFEQPELPLLCGSGGLALSVAAVVGRKLGRKPGQPCRPAMAFGSPLLMVGTDHAATAAQVLHLKKNGRADVLGLDALGGSSGTKPALVCVDWSAPLDFRALKKALRSGCYGALILTGGSTARTVLEALEAGRIDLLGQFGPGLPWGRIHGGVADGLLVAVKSGGFGGNDTLEMILRHFLAGRGAR